MSTASEFILICALNPHPWVEFTGEKTIARTIVAEDLKSKCSGPARGEGEGVDTISGIVESAIYKKAYLLIGH